MQLWRDTKKDAAADKKLKTTLRAIVVKKGKDSANKDLEIWKDPEIQEACKSQGQMFVYTNKHLQGNILTKDLMQDLVMENQKLSEIALNIQQS